MNGKCRNNWEEHPSVTKNTLWNRFLEVWEELALQIHCECIDSMQTRMQIAIQAEGLRVKY